MDEKTLEYMGKRVDKARQIRKLIDGIDSILIKMKNGSRVEFIKIYHRDCSSISIRETLGINSEAMDAIFNQSIINALIAQRAELQAELDAL